MFNYIVFWKKSLLFLILHIDVVNKIFYQLIFLFFLMIDKFVKFLLYLANNNFSYYCKSKIIIFDRDCVFTLKRFNDF